MDCECSNKAKYECPCGTPICQECIDDPTNPASINWHGTGWTVCSYKCEEKAIDTLKDECDAQGLTIRQSAKDMIDIIRYTKAARDSLYSGKTDTALLDIGRILSFDSPAKKSAQQKPFTGSEINPMPLGSK